MSKSKVKGTLSLKRKSKAPRPKKLPPYLNLSEEGRIGLVPIKAIE